jgi:hypothetical protein
MNLHDFCVCEIQKCLNDANYKDDYDNSYLSAFIWKCFILEENRKIRMLKRHLSMFLNFYLPKSNRCYENYVYLLNISERSFVLHCCSLAYVYFVNSLVMLLLCCYFSLYHCIWLYENKDIYIYIYIKSDE